MHAPAPQASTPAIITQQAIISSVISDERIHWERRMRPMLLVMVPKLTPVVNRLADPLIFSLIRPGFTGGKNTATPAISAAARKIHSGSRLTTGVLSPGSVLRTLASTFVSSHF